MTDKKLQIYSTGDNSTVTCSFTPPTNPSIQVGIIALEVMIYITGDLKFQAMVLGREGMSGQHCLVCKLKCHQFQNIDHDDGELWMFPDLVSTAKQIAASKSGKPINGVKKEPWWPFLNINHFMVPLLHVEIGIGNNLLDRFCHIINAFIEKLSTEEIKLIRALGTYKNIINKTVKDRKAFDLSPAGTQLESLKGKITSRRRKLNVIAASG